MQPIDALTIRTLSTSDLSATLKSGISDFSKRPFMSAFFGLVYAAAGLFMFVGLFQFQSMWMIIPVALGFPLIAPFAAAGLYEISRRLAKGDPFNWRDVLTIVFRQQSQELGWMAFVVLFVFWIWIYQVRLMIALFLGFKAFSSLEGFTEILLNDPNGLLFLGIGSLVGAFIATVLFSITVISMPLLLDRQIDFISAMIFSVKTVSQNKQVMAIWALIIAALLFAAMLPFFAGLIVVLPVLGHATWHLYKRAVVVSTP